MWEVQLVTDGIQWIEQSYSDEGVALVFCENLEPEELLMRLGADRDCIIPLTRADAQTIEVFNHYPDDGDLNVADSDEEELREKGFFVADGQIVRAGVIPGWCFGIQSFGACLGDIKLLRRASHGTRCISYTQTVNYSTWVTYMRDGEVLSSFDPESIPEPSGHGLRIPRPADGVDPVQHLFSHLEEEFSLWVPRASDFDQLPAACLPH